MIKLINKLLTIINMPNIKKGFEFKIGADPEFVLTMQGRKVDAKQTMQLVLNRKTGFKADRNDQGFDVEPFGNIGWDGASSTAEVRPNASHSPQEVVNNLGGMFKAFVKHIRLCDMSTISEYSSVGGHIHLEIPKGDKWSTEKRNTIHRRMASFYLPILISENKTNLNLRLKQGYGSLKDQRIEAKFKYADGAPGFTYEFRCPSAEWLTTPKLAQATIAYMGVVYNEILRHPKNFSKFTDIIYKSDKQGDALQTLAIMEFDLLTQSILNKVKKYVRTFEMYQYYKDEIEYLFNPKQVIKDKQKADYNIAIGWNLIGKTIPKKSEILASKKKIQGIAAKKDFDNLKSVMNIHYNADTNVALFAESLKDRVAAFNWKLKNNYFLFGMRKGIPAIIAKNLKKEYLTGQKIIKTVLEKEYTDRLFDKMGTKFNNANGVLANATLDFTTGKIKDMRESVIVIGIPYSMRIEENIKPFLNFIWTLEKGEIPKMNKKDETRLIDDTNLPLEQKGEIYRILTKQTDTPQENIIMDTGSHSLRNHENALNEMIVESQQNA
jgi:hypothetical protein